MDEKFPVDSGRRFAADLRGIRIRKGITLDEIYEQTRVRHELISMLEDTALFEHELFNRVYLRALVRRYAEILQIDPEVTLISLDEALKGMYEGRLGQQYLEEYPGGNTPGKDGERGSGRIHKTHRKRRQDLSENIVIEPISES